MQITGTQRIQGHQPLVLSNSALIWIVVAGSVAVFTTSMVAGQTDDRRHLFNISPGEALFGIASETTQSRVLLAVALESTDLQAIPFQQFIGQMEAGDEEAIALCETWVNQLAQSLTVDILIPKSSPLIQRSVSLEPEQTLSCPQLCWVEVCQGELIWLAKADLILTPDTAVFPLPAQTELTASVATELNLITKTELDSSEIETGLALLHSYFLSYLNAHELAQKEAAFRRFQTRNQLNRQATQAAIGQLATVFQPHQTEFFALGSPLLIAVGAVARAHRMEVKAPKQEDAFQQRREDPLLEIARLSGFRTRRVLLADDWWQREGDALLAYTQDDRAPVSLLPNSQGKHPYVLFHPEAQQRIPVDQAVAETLEDQAYTFYRPLPAMVQNVGELFRFGIIGHRQDLIRIVLIGVIITLLGMVVPAMTGMLIDQAVPNSDRFLLWQMGFGLLAAAFGRAAFELSRNILTLRVEITTDNTLQLAVWDRLLKLTPAFFRQYLSGDLFSRLLAVRDIHTQLSGATQRTLLSSLFSLLNLILLFVYSARLAWVVLGITVVSVFITVVSGVLIVHKERRREQLDGAIDSLTVQLIDGVAKLRVAVAEERAFAAWAAKYAEKIKLTAGIQRLNDSLSTFNETLLVVSSALLFWFAMLFMHMAAANDQPTPLTAGSFLAFHAAFGIFISGVSDLSNTVTDVLRVVPQWERAKAIIQSPTEAKPHQSNVGCLRGRVVFDHVTFRYRAEGSLVLDSVSLRADPGEFIAIVGPSGSGKSSLFRLLLGFENPASGAIYYDGQDLAGLDVASVRRQLGVVL